MKVDDLTESQAVVERHTLNPTKNPSFAALINYLVRHNTLVSIAIVAKFYDRTVSCANQNEKKVLQRHH